MTTMLQNTATEMTYRKYVYDTNDIMEMFQVKYAKACSIIRGIKSVSNIANMKGKVTLYDYEQWCERKDK